MTTDLKALRDELAHADRCNSDVVNEDWNTFHAFQRGFDAALQALAGMEPEFDEKAIDKAAKDKRHHDQNSGSDKSFYQGAHWQHSQDKAVVGALKAELVMEKDYADDIREKLEDAKELVPKLRAELAEKDAEIDNLKKHVKAFQVFGSDDCRRCETGRITLFIKHPGICVECEHKTLTPQGEKP